MFKEILVVDDSATIRNLAQIMFRNSPGVTVHVAGTGDEAEQLLRGQPGIDAILLDINMPGDSGLHVLANVRKLGGHFATLPVVIMSADDRDKTVVEAMRIGANGYIKKPFSLVKLTELFDRIHAHHTGKPRRRKPAAKAVNAPGSARRPG